MWQKGDNVMYKIAKDNLTALFRTIAGERELYLPVKLGGQVNFAVWEEGDEVSLDTLKTVKSPKDAFFPQFETLYTCKKEGKKLSIEPQALKDREFVVFGIRACDVQGLKVLDNVFLSEPVDTYYAARREHGILVALACHEPEESCFCSVFGVDAAEPAADVAAWMIGDELFWKPLTEKGERLTAAARGCLQDSAGNLTGHAAQDSKNGQSEAAGAALQMGGSTESGPLLAEAPEGPEKVEREQAQIRAIMEKLPYAKLSLEGWGGSATDEKFNSPVWETLYKPCLACGTCTFVCPTCQCYDIKDYQTANGVQRYRCWDSCMYSDFTLMAAGNNRTTQLQRFRQRFMHKLVYYPANNNGMYSCVGCGRCVEKCPSALNIVKVIKAFEKQGGGEHV